MSETIRSIVEMYTRKRNDLLLQRWDGGLEDAEVHTVEVDNLVEAIERHMGTASSPPQRVRTDDELDALLESADIVAEMAGLEYGDVPKRDRRRRIDATARCDSPHDEVVAEEIRRALGRIKSEVCRLHPGAVCRGAVFLVVAYGASSAIDPATGLATLRAIYEVEE